ncbi:DUF5693 family protein [Veillonella agrestimuris]|uniref:DUF5693 family protein n=1 Tax=Veillonella agrestimuris TaxID=2941340 RepID=UPI0020408777|nr:DUF5693 family protein [Veillonella agrestimuris]
MINKTKHSLVLIACIIIGLLSSLYLVVERHNVEKVQNHIENIVDYDAVLRANAFEKRSQEEAFDALKDAGVTAFAIYDRTLEKANDAGHIKLLNAQDLSNVRIDGDTATPGATYVALVPGKEGYYREIREDLYHRISKDKVKELQTSIGPVLQLYGASAENYAKLSLGISKIQAMEVADSGFNVIVRPTNYRNVTPEDIAHVFSRLEGVPRVTGMIFAGKEVLGAPHYIDETLAHMDELHIPLVGIEAVNQLQYEPQMGFLEMAAKKEYSVGRVYTIAKEELKKIAPQEAAQRFYISDIERNIRFNLFPVYETGQNNETVLQTTINYIDIATTKLAEKGYKFGPANIYPPYEPNPIALGLTIIGSVALFIYVGQMLIAMQKIWQIIAFVVLSILSLVGMTMTSGTLITQVWAFFAAILAPVGAMILLMEEWRRYSESLKIEPWKATILSLFYLLVAAIIAAVGAMYVAALLGNTRFFMEFALFRGVKLTFVLPVILVAIAYLQRFPLWKGRMINSSKEAKQFVVEFFTADVKMYVFFVVAALGAAGWIFVGRSGHTAGVPVPSFELMLRRFLENTLYARPREKEFLIGHPALMLATFALLRKWPMVIHFVLTIAGVIGIASMVQTFCHVRTPVFMSIMRGYDGLLLGAVLGVVAIIGVRLCLYIAQWFVAKEESHE